MPDATVALEHEIRGQLRVARCAEGSASAAVIQRVDVELVKHVVQVQLQGYVLRQPVRSHGVDHCVMWNRRHIGFPSRLGRVDQAFLLAHVARAAANRQLVVELVGGPHRGRDFRRPAAGCARCGRGIAGQAFLDLSVHGGQAGGHAPVLRDLANGTQFDTLHLALAQLRVGIGRRVHQLRELVLVDSSVQGRSQGQLLLDHVPLGAEFQVGRLLRVECGVVDAVRGLRRQREVGAARRGLRIGKGQVDAAVRGRLVQQSGLEAG